MADKKITELVAHTTLIDTDVFPIVDITALATKKIAFSTLKSTLKTYNDGLYDALNTASGLLSTHNSTYDHANIANGQTAYGWGNHANAGYLLATGATTGATSQAQTFSNGIIGNVTGTASGNEVPLTFGNGLTRTVNAVANNLITGLAGGQTIYGGTLTTQGLTIQANSADTTTGAINITTSTASTSATTGALTIAGGLGVSGAAYYSQQVVSNIYFYTLRVTTTNSLDGFLTYSGAATAGVPVRLSPRLRLIGSAWNTTPTAAANTVSFAQEVLPVSGTTTSGSLIWYYNNSGVGSTYAELMRLTSTGNLGIGTSTFGANAVTVLGLANGTAPAAHVDNTIQIYSVDSSDATATLGLMLEQAVEDIGTFTESHKIKVCINGTFYYISLDAV